MWSTGYDIILMENKIGFNNCEKGRKDIKKNMKYKIQYYITLIVLCMMMLQNVVYAETTVFQIENQKGKKNETVTVPIEIHSGEEVGGFELSVYYNKETLEFVGLNKGKLIENDNNSLFDYNHKEDKAFIKIVYVVADIVKADGEIVNIEFKLKKDCTDKLPIGMKIDEIIDNTEESNTIAGTATGVDQEFQKIVDGQSKDSAESAESVENTENTAQTEQEENVSEQENATSKEETKNGLKENKETNKEKTVNKVKRETKKKSYSVNKIRKVIVGMIVIAGILAILIKKKKTKEETK